MPINPIPSHVSDFLNDVAKRIDGEVRTDTMSRVLYSTDASMYEMVPHGVLLPKSADDVHAAVEAAARHEVPVIPRGGGSSLAGQVVGTALVIDFTKWLNRLVKIDLEQGKAVVQPGIVLDQLNALLRDTGWMFGPDPASSSRATLGGMFGNNSTGTHSIVYGATIDHVDSVRAVFHDGARASLGPLDPQTWASRVANPDLDDTETSIMRRLQTILEDGAEVIRSDTPPHWRNCGGYRLERFLPGGFRYHAAANGQAVGIQHPAPVRSEHAAPGDSRNLAHLLCGSEGTLGIATELTINLVRRPTQTALGVVHFKTRIEAMAAVPTLLETGPTAVELFDRHGLDMCRQSPGYAPRLVFVEGDPDALLLTEYRGNSETELRSKLDQLDALSEQRGVGYTVVKVRKPEAIANVWELRKAGLGLILGVRGDHKPLPFIEDAAVPPEHLADYIGSMEKVLADTKTRAAMYAHASAGCVHVRPFINTKDASDVQKMHEIGLASMQLVKSFGGSLSSEHADGLARSSFNEAFYGRALYDLYRRTKQAFDPKGILNPGKVVDAPPMTENLRVSPNHLIVAVSVTDDGAAVSNLDFSGDQGFNRSIEMCTGIGQCRKLGGGTMCPSFMVTREEKDSTRGRANALRAALNGNLGPEGLGSAEMYDVMALCISCKACKTECPSGVDMARLKLEWQDHYWKSHKMPRRDRRFACMPETARRVSGRLAPLVNGAMKLGSVGGMAQRFLGVSPKRSLPTFARQSLIDWFENRDRDRGARDEAGDARKVVLFADTFNTFQDANIGVVAVELLEGLGYQVSLSGSVCCGRTYMSKGLVDRSRELAAVVVERLLPFALEGTPIVGLEPSCILSLRDEYESLLPGDPRVELVAGHTKTFEEFIVEQSADGYIRSDRFREHGTRAMIHGHCHQKSLVGMEPSRGALELAGYAVEIVDSGCCGMAGSFGYESENYRWSVAMAERVLAPAIRSTPDDTVVVAAGTSCRAQISDTTGRTAVHPVTALSRVLRH